MDTKQEYIKQRKEYIIKKGQYARLEIIVSGQEEEKMEPVITTELVKVTCDEVGKLMLAIESTLEELKKMYPLEYMYSKVTYGIKNIGTQVSPRKDEEEKENGK